MTDNNLPINYGSKKLTIRNVNKSLKITDKLLSETANYEKHWQWWLSLSDEWRIMFLSTLRVVEPTIIDEHYPYTYCNFDETFKKIKQLEIDIDNKADIKKHLLHLVDLSSICISEDLCPLDLSPLAYLKNLEEVYLVGCGIGDISPLSSLNKLKVLNLGIEVRFYMKDSSVEQYEPCNHITDISQLRNLTNLTELDLSGNPIPQSDIDWLRKQLPNCEIIF